MHTKTSGSAIPSQLLQITASTTHTTNPSNDPGAKSSSTFHCFFANPCLYEYSKNFSSQCLTVAVNLPGVL